MKNLVFAVVAIVAFAACKQSPKTSEAAGSVATAAPTAATYVIDPSASTLGWKGSKVVTGSHNGTINITEGLVTLENDVLKTGRFTIDMKTITILDDEKDKAKLVGHLSSPDFFAVDSFPTATFEITKTEKLQNADANGNNYLVSGNLTLRGVTREITFPAKVTVEDNKVTAVASTEINRIEWNVMWGNENDKGAREFLKENFLSNMIGININLVTKK
ncbi:MAG TPA: YceI family protein [Bacteroidia bacterium]|nr:YceI family protein [Bacteroidia bacterium]